jgi:hypothetical protein
VTGKRYAVIDKNGKCVNHILINDPLPAGYWPGYGSHLVPLEPVEIGKGAGLDVVVFEKMPVLPQIGDTIDLDTGVVTKFVPQIVEQKDEKGDPILDEKGDPLLVSEAPEVTLARDVAPKGEGTVTTKEGDTTKDAIVEGGK